MFAVPSPVLALGCYEQSKGVTDIYVMQQKTNKNLSKLERKVMRLRRRKVRGHVLRPCKL